MWDTETDTGTYKRRFSFFFFLTWKQAPKKPEKTPPKSADGSPLPKVRAVLWPTRKAFTVHFLWGSTSVPLREPRGCQTRRRSGASASWKITQTGDRRCAAGTRENLRRPLIAVLYSPRWKRGAGSELDSTGAWSGRFSMAFDWVKEKNLMTFKITQPVHSVRLTGSRLLLSGTERKSNLLKTSSLSNKAPSAFSGKPSWDTYALTNPSGPGACERLTTELTIGQLCAIWGESPELSSDSPTLYYPPHILTRTAPEMKMSFI